MSRDSAQLPVDFLAGFTIFILSLIMVSNYVPSLLVGLQRTSGIDYDAVAYRTGVVLAEDPGDPAGGPVIGEVPPLEPPPWEQQLAPIYINRLGLAYSRDTPNILAITKIEKIFDTSFFSDTDYRDKLLFSSYQYGYNITLQNISPMKAGEPPLAKMLGPPYPESYGYIRRYVAIKQNSNATLNLQTFWIGNAFIAQEDQDVRQEFRIRLNGSLLYNPSIDTPLKIDLQRQPIVLRIRNFSSVLNNSELNAWSPIANNSVQWGWNEFPENSIPIDATLTYIRFYTMGTYNDIPGVAQIQVSADGEVPQPVPPMGGPLNKKVKDTLDIFIDPLLGGGAVKFDYYQGLDIGLAFENSPPHTLIRGTFLYDYNPLNVTQPDLSTGILEVGIW